MSGAPSRATRAQSSLRGPRSPRTIARATAAIRGLRGSDWDRTTAGTAPNASRPRIARRLLTENRIEHELERSVGLAPEGHLGAEDVQGSFPDRGLERCDPALEIGLSPGPPAAERARAAKPRHRGDA